eukprot:6729128-Pyramimonas_sp.AAC.1
MACVSSHRRPIRFKGGRNMPPFLTNPIQGKEEDASRHRPSQQREEGICPRQVRSNAQEGSDARASAALTYTGLDWTGLDWTGLDRTRLDWTGPYQTGMEWTGPDWTGPDWTRLDQTGPDWTRLAPLTCR